MNRGGRDRSNREAGICFEFQTKGQCTRNRCRFKHIKNGDSAKEPPKGKRPVRVQETPAQQEARKVYNEWMRLLGTRNDANDTNIMRRVWQGAFDILQAGDRDWIQQLPVDLDSDDDIRNGRQHLQAILDAHVQHGDHTTFITNCRYFLLTLTHNHLVSSLAVDSYVGSIYNFVSGVNGVRAVTFFDRLCKAVVQAQTNNYHGVAMDKMESTLQLMSTALKEMLRRERRARLQDKLPSLLDALDTTAVLFTPVTSALVNKRTSDMRAMIARANSMLAGGEKIQEATLTSSYPRNLVVPSCRHDNDKLDITEITIFPTREEILTDVEEFLPFTDYDQPHFLSDPRQRHIDTYFRLLRHDMFSDLKEALAGIIHMALRNGGALQDSKLSLRDIKANHYSQCVVSDVEFSDRQGLYASMTFLQPLSVQKKSARHQKTWWEDAGRFERGTLLSFLWQTQSVVQHMFLTCLERDLRQFTLEDETGEPFATVKVQLTTNDEANLRKLMEVSLTGKRGILLEFPRIRPATFTPILENLQAIQRLGQFPFHEWIIPECQEACLHTRVTQDVPPPLYARAANFSFPLNSIVREALSINPTDSYESEELLNKIENCTSLDRGQCHALVAALSRELAFIQGPPGTGKSYIGLQLVKVLLSVRKKAELGPILIVSYINHALDQFLEHLIKTDIREIIRIGSQSQSTLIQEHNLQHMGQEERKTNAENWLARDKYRDIDDHTRDARSILRNLRSFRRVADWSVLEAHLTTRYPKIQAQFPRVDEEGYELVGQYLFDSWRSTDNSGARSNRDAAQFEQASDLEHLLDKATRNVYSLSYGERQHLLYHWVRELHDEEVDGLFQIVHRAVDTKKQLANIHSEANLRVLQQAQVIGITTSGLASRITLLKKLRCKVIICEEGGEILEPHMVSALLPSVEHCIQIGDHQQLRPSVNNYDNLSLESRRGQLHQLDRSQFERLVVGEPGRPVMPVAQLNVQRRMRPEISTLIRETVYGKLTDHESTTKLPDVVGLRHNVYWLDHDNLECTPGFDARNMKSKSNDWEVMFVHALVRHVVRQGVYKSSDVAVLTPYTGQLQKLRAAMYSDFEIILSDRDREALEKDGFEADGQLSDKAEEDDDTSPRKASATDTQSHKRKPLRKKQLGELL
ncbi:hypothetical protein E8E13_004750 [Curvularia kusanoi]|uniref:C3H1-type domain-containing protein n=1 Tax=Curvularia kusanoi TaxID=90978 RepID=A0A9P4T5P5_CURKU|nr:hypothetical protein E8E13_004750 [Curvularia kusanoi]